MINMLTPALFFTALWRHRKMVSVVS